MKAVDVLYQKGGVATCPSRAPRRRGALKGHEAVVEEAVVEEAVLKKLL